MASDFDSEIRLDIDAASPAELQRLVQEEAATYLPEIISAQLTKAVSGDTTSAKFVIEYSSPAFLVSGQLEGRNAAWEDLAIELRNNLQLEISAEILVELLLKAMLKKPNNEVLNMLA